MAKTKRRNHKVRRTKTRRGGVPPNKLNLRDPVSAVLHAKLRRSHPKHPEDDPLTTWWDGNTKHVQKPHYGIRKSVSNYARAYNGEPLHNPTRFSSYPLNK